MCDQELRPADRIRRGRQTLSDDLLDEDRIRQVPERAGVHCHQQRELAADPGPVGGAIRALAGNRESGFVALLRRIASVSGVMVVSQLLECVHPFIVRVCEVERTLVQLQRFADSETPTRRSPSFQERSNGTGSHALEVFAVGANQLVSGCGEVQGDELDQFIAIRHALLEPGRRRQVGIGSSCCGQRRVRHVAQECMLERVLVVAARSRRRVGRDQSAALEIGEAGCHGFAGKLTCDQLARERPAHHGCFLEHTFLERWQRIDPRSEQGVQRVGQRRRLPFGEMHHHLLDEVRVPFGPCQHVGAEVVVETLLGGQHLEQLAAGTGCQGWQRDRRRCLTPRSEAGMVVEQLGPRGDQHHQRRPDTRHHPLQSVEQLIVRPVHVLDHQQCRSCGGQRRGKSRPCPAHLVGDDLRPELTEASLRHIDSRCRGKGRNGDHDVAIGEVEGSQQHTETFDQPRGRRGCGFAEADDARFAKDLPQRPIGDTVAEAQASPAPDHRARPAVGDGGENLGHQAALADAGIANEREQMRTPVGGDIAEDAEHRFQLGVAANHRQRRTAIDRGTCCQDSMGCHIPMV